MKMTPQPPENESHGQLPTSTGRWLATVFILVGLLAVVGLAAFALQPPNDDLGLSVDGSLQEDERRQPNKLESNVQMVEKAELPVNVGPSWQSTDNPAADGWDTEVFSEQALAALKQIGKWVANPKKIDHAKAAELVTDDFVCSPWIPHNRQTVFRDAVFEIERDVPVQSVAGRPLGKGPQQLIAEIRQLAKAFANTNNVLFKFKLFHVQEEGEFVVTRQYFAISGEIAASRPGGVREQNATWRAHWRRGKSGAAPKLVSLLVEQFEQAESKSALGPLFSDVTASVMKGNACYQEQFLYGIHHWFKRLQDTRYSSSLGHPGLAVGDVNGDGLEDLFVCQEAGLPNRLFLQRADGTLQDVSQEWGVDWLENSRSALLVDLDNDGDQDLVVATVGNLVVAANTGKGFTIRALLPTNDDAMSLSAADYDLDGDLDLFVCVYFQNDVLQQPPARLLGGVAATSQLGGAKNSGGGANSLFRNDLKRDGAWKFRDVAAEVGLEVETRHSYAAAWEDFDNDGDPDLYIANDFGRNDLYRNDGGKFTEIARAAKAEDSAFGMSVSWGDYDRDGWMDVYIANMFSAAGGRVTHQSRFVPEDAQLKTRLQRFARGNTLLRNLGNGAFEDVSETAAVMMGRWGWSSNFVDINNDGWEDLVCANGFITTEDSGDL